MNSIFFFSSRSLPLPSPPSAERVLTYVILQKIVRVNLRVLFGSLLVAFLTISKLLQGL